MVSGRLSELFGIALEGMRTHFIRSECCFRRFPCKLSMLICCCCRCLMFPISLLPKHLLFAVSLWTFGFRSYSQLLWGLFCGKQRSIFLYGVGRKTKSRIDVPFGRHAFVHTYNIYGNFIFLIVIYILERIHISYE